MDNVIALFGMIFVILAFGFIVHILVEVTQRAARNHRRRQQRRADRIHAIREFRR